MSLNRFKKNLFSYKDLHKIKKKNKNENDINKRTNKYRILPTGHMVFVWIALFLYKIKSSRFRKD